MSLVSVVLLGFVLLGLARERLGVMTYLLMGVFVVGYVAYAYSHPQ
jgi:hypothetical protein